MGFTLISFFNFRKLCIIINILVALRKGHNVRCDPYKIPGHLKKIGSQGRPLGTPWTGKFPASIDFFRNHVKSERPVLMKEVLQQVDHPGLVDWTDNFLSKKYGDGFVKVEQSRIENRDSTPSLLQLKEFINIYQTKDVYMVQSLNNKMKDLALIPSTLHCGGFQNLIQDIVLWMGSHHASSVLHRDPLDNLLCLLDGKKDILLIDKAHKPLVESDGFDFEQGYSKVDPLKVDFGMFPQLAHVPWHEAKLKKGDCLYIPQGWYHQVTSGGFRHLSINIWFPRLWWFNTTDCPSNMTHHRHLEPISTFGFASPNEVHRSTLLSNFKDDIVTRFNFQKLLPNSPTDELTNELFDAINEFPDNALSWSELYSFDIDKILVKFSGIFNLIGEKNIAESTSEDTKDLLLDHFLKDKIRTNDGTENQNDKYPSKSFQEVLPELELHNSDKFEDHIETLHPLADSVSGKTPSLPDDSVHIGFDISNDATNYDEPRNNFQVDKNSNTLNDFVEVPVDKMSGQKGIVKDMSSEQSEPIDIVYKSIKEEL